jgi:hypothetical protein
MNNDVRYLILLHNLFSFITSGIGLISDSFFSKIENIYKTSDRELHD